MLGVDVGHMNMEVIEFIWYYGLQRGRLVRSRRLAKALETAENNGQGVPRAGTRRR